ncbi:hypothetical protein BDFB_006593 [Asbolus verrucosus]|uniref:Uncharacterized protein n=1 Tax=Asbolus verrucosus TaxID=1661398 RepID=A0A482VDE4_ASBVE|nr:hypothetical protein BDFB_006593 [Asbolus verrucosus]
MSDYKSRWERNRPQTTHELLSELENITDEDPNQYDVYITPPNDERNVTDEDSGEEYCNDPDRLNKNQLMADAELYSQSENNDDGNSNNNKAIENESGEIPHKRKIKEKKETRNWRNGDLQEPLYSLWTEVMLTPLSLSSFGVF